MRCRPGHISLAMAFSETITCTTYILCGKTICVYSPYTAFLESLNMHSATFFTHSSVARKAVQRSSSAQTMRRLLSLVLEFPSSQIGPMWLIELCWINILAKNSDLCSCACRHKACIDVIVGATPICTPTVSATTFPAGICERGLWGLSRNAACFLFFFFTFLPCDVVAPLWSADVYIIHIYSIL